MKPKEKEFHKTTMEERLNRLGIKKMPELSLEQANNMVENVIGTMKIPLGVAPNFKINDKDYFVPMATEESSVIAAASNGARIARIKGGFHTTSTEPIMIGQVQLINVSDPKAARVRILHEKEGIIKECNNIKSKIIELGGGCKDIEVRKAGEHLLVHLHVDTQDAMGANFINAMCERIAPRLEKIAGGKTHLRILSNFAVHRLARARAVFDKETLGGEEVVDGILKAYDLAKHDIFRRVTHNKGVTNGICAVAMATGNDYRAVDAGCHAYSAFKDAPITHFEKNADGDLVGTIEVPMQVGIVGGITKAHPTAKKCLELLGVKSARELGEVIASVGLAQNLAALKALSTEGIQKGHMRLHAKNVADSAGATGEQVDAVAEQMIKEGNVSESRARELLSQ